MNRLQLWLMLGGMLSVGATVLCSASLFQGLDMRALASFGAYLLLLLCIMVVLWRLR